MKRLSLQILSVFVLAATPLAAANPVPSDDYRDKVKGLDIFQVPEGVRLLSLKELHGIILRQGYAVRIAQKVRDASLEKYGLFYDKLLPTPKIDASTSETKAKADESFSRTQTNSGGLSVGGALPYGFDYSVDVPRVSRSFSPEPGDAPAATSAAIGASLGVNLLQGSAFFERGLPIEQAELDRRTALLTYQTALAAAVQAADAAFFDIVEQRFSLLVQKQALAASKSLLAEVHEMIRVGQKEKNAAVRVDLQIAQSENELIGAELTFDASMQALKDLMSVTDDQIYFPDPNEFKTIPQFVPESLPDAVKKARAKRPDYQLAKIAIASAKLNEKASFSATLPSLKLTTGYAYNGTDEKVGHALAEARDRQNPSSTVGLAFTYTLGNTDAATAHKNSVIERARVESELDQLESRILKEVTNASRALEASFRSLKISTLTRELAAEKQNQEYEKFRLGESTLREVIDAKKDLDQARIGETKATIATYKAMAAYRVATGELPLDLTDTKRRR